MKKSIIILCVVMLTFSMVGAVETLTGGGIGWMVQKGVPTSSAFFVEFGGDLVEKPEAGFVQKIQASYLYANPEGGEVQAERLYTYSEKTIVSFVGGKACAALGVGFWNFSNTSGDDQQWGAYGGYGGVTWNGFSFKGGCDVVLTPEANIIFPHVGLNITF